MIFVFTSRADLFYSDVLLVLITRLCFDCGIVDLFDFLSWFVTTSLMITSLLAASVIGPSDCRMFAVDEIFIVISMKGMRGELISVEVDSYFWINVTIL